MTKEEFYRELGNYVLINNDIYRFEYETPTKLNSTPINKGIFRNKFGFSEEEWSSLPEFDGYTNEPLHIDYRYDINGKWNEYSQVTWNPTDGEWPTIRKLIEHTYGDNGIESDQTEELYDYHTVLLKHPKQMQQARVLYSHTQGTSKSAVAVLESMMLQANFSKIGKSEMDQPFNSIFASALMIWLDEPFFAQPLTMSRKFRDWITSTDINLRKMKTDYQKIPFYGKFLFTTNDSNFMPFEKGDRRYWIRELPAFKKEDEDSNFEDKMRNEINHYIYFLLNRVMKYKVKSDKTFWLPQKAITSTYGFKKLVGDTQNEFERASIEVIERWFITHPTHSELYFRLKDLRTEIAKELEKRSSDIPQQQLAIMLREGLGITQPQKNTRTNKDTPTLITMTEGTALWWIAKREDFDCEVDIFDTLKVGIHV